MSEWEILQDLVVVAGVIVVAYQASAAVYRAEARKFIKAADVTWRLRQLKAQGYYGSQRDWDALAKALMKADWSDTGEDTVFLRRR